MQVDQVNISETQINAIAICFWFVCRTPLWFENYSEFGSSVSPWDTDCLGTPSLENCTYECGPLYDDSLSHYVSVLNDVMLTPRPRWLSKYSQATLFTDLRDWFSEYNVVNFLDIYYSFNATLAPAIENASLGTILRNSSGAYLMVYWGDEPFYYYRSGFVVFFLTTYVALITVIPPSPICSNKSTRGKGCGSWSFWLHVVLWVIAVIVPVTLLCLLTDIGSYV